MVVYYTEYITYQIYSNSYINWVLHVAAQGGRPCRLRSTTCPICMVQWSVSNFFQVLKLELSLIDQEI
jgi:hypothetical protein